MISNFCPGCKLLCVLFFQPTYSAGVYKSPGRLDVNLKALRNNFGSTSLNVSLHLRAFLRLE